MFKSFLQKAIKGYTFSEQEAKAVMDEIMRGHATSSQIASLLTITALRESTVAEITGFAQSMREHAMQVEHDEEVLLDTCGTGGDGSSTFNISTTVALLLSAAGIPIAKHGNRSVSSKSGSADVLERLGIPVQSTPEEAAQRLKKDKLCFMYAPLYHSSIKHAVVPRKEIGFRTVFNILGPLTNPARSSHQLLGVYHPSLANKMAKALRRLGTKRALIVSGRDGLDECSIADTTDVVELKDGKITEYTLSPDEVGLPKGNNQDLTASSVEESTQLIIDVLKGEASDSAVNIVLLNAGAALYVVGATNTIAEGVHEARKVIQSGAAYKKLTELATEEVSLRA